MAQALALLHEINRRKLPVVLEYAVHRAKAQLFCRMPKSLGRTFRRQLADHYPNCRIERVSDDALDTPAGFQTWTANLRLKRDVFPIQNLSEFEEILTRNMRDPLTSILSTIAPAPGNPSLARIEIQIIPAGRWQRIFARLRLFLKAVRLLKQSRILAAVFAKRQNELSAASEKLERHLYAVHLRLIIHTPPSSKRLARNKIHEMAGAFAQFTAGSVGMFRLSRIRRHRKGIGRTLYNCLSWRAFILSELEIATLWHPVTLDVKTAKVAAAGYRQFEPPVEILHSTKEEERGMAELGRVNYRSLNNRFGIRRLDRSRHLAVIGKTGMGKSTLLRRLIASDIQKGRGVGLVDPHGDLAQEILRDVPRHRTNDVVLFDAGDRTHPLAFNPLACRSVEQRPLVASAVVSAFKKLFADSWGPRLEHILRNALLALVEQPGTTLVSLSRMLSDRRFRKQIVSEINDPLVRNFWREEFGHWSDRMKAEAVAPIQNKVGQFLSSPIVRAIVGQPENCLDIRQIMDDGRILIVNLSKGRIGEDVATLLGSLLVTKIQIDAMTRAELDPADRRDWYLYVDEFQNFATESFATILSEARKYSLNLTLANQYLAQMDEATAAALFGNVGSLLCFQVGSSDAEVLAEQLAGDVTPEDLIGLPKFAAYVRLLIDGMPSRPFSMSTLPPARQNGQDRSPVIRRTSRRRYARPASQVFKQLENTLSVV